MTIAARRPAMGLFPAAVVAVLLIVVVTGRRPQAGGETFAAAGRQAVAALVRVYYDGNGGWRACDAPGCRTGDLDWGYDSLTYTLALPVTTTREKRLRALLLALAANAPVYSAGCRRGSRCHSWSDVPEWDAVALADEYQATGDPVALAKAKAAFAYVAHSRAFALGACPSIPYQQPGGGRNHLKTLETEANAVKAALLLYRVTGHPAYLAFARAGYTAARAHFLDPQVALYTVYTIDDGHRCRQLPHRFFASVNGDMIWSGVELSGDTGRRSYLDQATATAEAVKRYLSDGRGVFADLQAENDVVEPLVEAMDVLARHGVRSARDWLLTNAAAALSARAPDGSFGRFFDGPPPATTVTAWQTNGGLALEVAAAAIAPQTVVRAAHDWASAPRVKRRLSTLPATVSFRGTGIALLGTLGEHCCEFGHARVLVDGRETFDRSGIWQDKSSSQRTIPGTILFAWRWPKAGLHTLSFLPGIPTPKEGGSFLHLVSYEVLGHG